MNKIHFSKSASIYFIILMFIIAPFSVSAETTQQEQLFSIRETINNIQLKLNNILDSFSGDTQRAQVASSVFPVNLKNKTTPEHKTIQLNLSKPSNATSATIVLTAQDPDFPNEGQLIINNNKPITLWGNYGNSANDNLTKNITIPVPASYFKNGKNTFTFKHTSTAGYIVYNVKVNFKTATNSSSISPSYYYRFDNIAGNKAKDSFGNKNGVIHGATYKTGKTGKALYFDGVNDYVDLGTIDLKGSAMTISTWIKSPDLTANCGADSNDCRIISKSTSSSNDDHYWMLSTIKSGANTRLRFRLKTGAQTDPTTKLIASSGNLKPNTWYYAVATYDGKMMRLYLNGNLIGSTPKTGKIARNNKVKVYIGANPDNSNYWKGKIDGLGIYSYAFPGTYISALYNSNKNISQPKPTPTPATTLPAKIQAEDYNKGGEGVGYHDTDTKNLAGSTYRKGGVDIGATSDVGGGYNLGWIQKGEWLKYTVNTTPGTYNIKARVASAISNPADIKVSLGGKTLGTFKVKPTGGWQKWTTITIPNVKLSGGTNQTLKLEMIGDSTNLNWIEFEKIKNIVKVPTPKPTPTPTNLANTTTLTSSSRLDSKMPASNMFDGCTKGTPTCTSGVSGTTSFSLNFDFKTPYKLTQARLFGDTAGNWWSKTWTLQYKQNKNDKWKTAFSRSNAFTNSWVTKNLSNITARYARVIVYGGSTKNSAQARELQLFGVKEGSPVPTPTTKFKPGDRVQTTDRLKVRKTPAGTLLGIQNSGAKGTITGGPRTVTLYGKTYTWWNINFDKAPDGWSVEKWGVSDSITKVVKNTVAPSGTQGDLLNVDFNNLASRLYTQDDVRNDWNTVGPVTLDPGAMEIVNDPDPSGIHDKTLRVNYEANKFGYDGVSGGQWWKILDDYDELYFSYDVYFEPGFDFVKGGKLPSPRSTGYRQNYKVGSPPNGTDFWTAGLLWYINGELVSYVYHANQTSQFGQVIHWSDGADGQKTYFTPGRWHRVEIRVKLNTPGVLDGRLQGWFDGERRLDTRAVMFRMPGGENLKIGTYFFYTFFGGGDSSFAPPKTEHVYFDNFVISTQPITH